MRQSLSLMLQFSMLIREAASSMGLRFPVQRACQVTKSKACGMSFATHRQPETLNLLIKAYWYSID